MKKKPASAKGGSASGEKKIKKASVSKKPAKKTAKKAKGPKPIGRITHYFGKINVGIVKLLAPLAVGDVITIKCHSGEFTQKIDSMQYNHKYIEKAKKGLEIGIKVLKKVHEGELVFRAEKSAQINLFTPPAAANNSFILKPRNEVLPFTKPIIVPSEPPKTVVPEPAMPPAPIKKPGYGNIRFIGF